MYDIKPVVFNLLKQIEGASVSDAYPKDWNDLPHISFYEQLNKDYHNKGEEYLTEIIIQVDVWHKRSTGTIATEVNNKLTSIGLKRQMSRDIPDPSVKHKTMRYRGIVDIRSLLIYQ